MRKFNALAALSAALLMPGGIAAKEKPGEAKPRKICRSEPLPGRITPKRICRVVSPSDSPAESVQGKSADPRQSGKSRD